MSICDISATLQKLEACFPEDRLTVTTEAGRVTVTDDVNGTYRLTPNRNNDKIAWLQIADGRIVNRFETKDRDTFQAAVNAIYFDDFGDLD